MAKKKIQRVYAGMKFADIPYFLTTAELGILLDKTQGAIRRGIRKGDIPADLIGGEYRICRDTVFKNTKEALHV